MLTVVLVTMGAMVINELLVFHQNRLQQLDELASAVAATSGAHIATGDRSAAEAHLRSFGQREGRITIALYDEQRVLFAYHPRSDGAPPALPVSLAPNGDRSATSSEQLAGYLRMLRNGKLSAAQTVFQQGQILGAVLVTSTLQDLGTAIGRYVQVSAAIFLGTVALTLLVSAKLQRSICQPIAHLNTVIDEIAQNQDYSLRAHAASRDELGALIAKFNEMLDMVEHRDRFLVEHNAQLEHRIAVQMQALAKTKAELAATLAQGGEATRTVESSDQANVLTAPLPSAAINSAGQTTSRLAGSASTTQVEPQQQPSDADIQPPPPVRPASLPRSITALLAGQVLVTDPPAAHRDGFLSWLRSLGLSVTTASNGWEVLAALDRAHFDLLLLDCQMPELDGLKTTAIVRRREMELQVPLAAGGPPRTRLSIVGIDSEATGNHRQSCLAAGMDDFISNPLDSHRVYQTLVRWLDGSRNPGSAAAAPSAARQMFSFTKPNKEYSAMSKSSSDVLLDQQALDNIRALQRPGSRVFEKVVGIYLKDCPSAIAELESALRAGDASRIAKLAHRLKSGSANLGATTLAEYLRDLEAIGRSGSCDGAAELLSQIKHEYIRVEAALHHELQRALAQPSE